MINTYIRMMCLSVWIGYYTINIATSIAVQLDVYVFVCVFDKCHLIRKLLKGIWSYNNR